MVICSYIPIFVGDFPSRFPHPAPWIMGKPRQQAHAFEAVEAASEFSWSISGGGFRGSPGGSLIFSGERMGQSQTQLYKCNINVMFSLWHVPPGWSPFCYSWNPLMSWMFDGFSLLLWGQKARLDPTKWMIEPPTSQIRQRWGSNIDPRNMKVSSVQWKKCKCHYQMGSVSKKNNNLIIESPYSNPGQDGNSVSRIKMMLFLFPCFRGFQLFGIVLKAAILQLGDLGNLPLTTTQTQAEPGRVLAGFFWDHDGFCTTDQQQPIHGLP